LPPIYRVSSLKNNLTYGPIIGGQVRGKIINAKIVDGSSTKKLESKWEINFNAYQEIIDLSNKSKKIIDWDIPYFQDLLSSYISEHPCCSEESAKRNLRRLIKKQKIER